MAYNLIAEGDLDLFELSRLVQHFAPVEMFPIPGPGGDALGIDLPSQHADDTAARRLSELIQLLWTKQAVVHDLMAGQQIASEVDLVELEGRILARH
jgi:hypothetical protein